MGPGRRALNARPLRTLGIASGILGAIALVLLLSAPSEGSFANVGSVSFYNSPDGINWASDHPTNPVSLYPYNMKGVVYGNGLWVAVGYNSPPSYPGILTSPDGITWTGRNSGATLGRQFNSVAFGNVGGTPMFAAVGVYDNNLETIYTSANGITWTMQQTGLPYADTMYGITYGTVGGVGRFVAVGYQGTTLSSTDGVLWTPSLAGGAAAPVTLYGVGWGNGLFTAVGASGKIFTSPDGSAWTLRTSSTPQMLQSVAYGGGQWITVGASNTILTSPDAITWTARSAGLANSWTTLYGVAYGGGRWVSVSNSYTPNATTYSSIAITSIDGINWESRPATAYYWYGPMVVAYGGGQFVAPGQYAIIRSLDGLNWIQAHNYAGYVKMGVASSGPLWVSVGYPGAISTSTDGKNWTARYSGLQWDYLYGVGYGAGQWVAVGYSWSTGSLILSSPDGIHWTPRTTSSSSWLYGVSFRAGQWVAVGESGTLLTSPDGVTWTSRTSGTGSTLRAVAAWDGNWTAVGYSGTIIGSADGITWTARTSPTTANLYAIAFDPVATGAKWVATGNSGVTVTSIDGITWSTVNSGTTASLMGVARDQGLWVASGADQVTRSPDASPGSWTAATYGAGAWPYSYAVASNAIPKLSCLPKSQIVGIGAPAVIGAGGGTMPYYWTAPGSNLVGPVSAASITRTYASVGYYNVTLSDSSTPVIQDVSCQVVVMLNPPRPVVPPTLGTACGYTVLNSTTNPTLYNFDDIDPAAPVNGGGTGVGSPNSWNFYYYGQTYAVPAQSPPMPFSFCGATYNTFWLSGSGMICLDTAAAPAGGTYSAYNPSGCGGGWASALPNAMAPNAAIYGEWAYYYSYYGCNGPSWTAWSFNGCIFYKIQGTAPNRVLIYEYKDVAAHFDPAARQTWEIKLFENSGCVEVHFKTAVPNTYQYPTASGFENGGGTLGYQYFFVPYGRSSPTLTQTAWQACPFSAVNDVYRVNEDQPAANFDVLANDNTGGLPATVTLDTNPTKGVLTALGGGNFSYAPTLNAVGADAFNYTITSSAGSTSRGRVRITINAIDDVPRFTASTAPIVVAASDGPYVGPGWASGVAAGPPTAFDEMGETVVFDLTNSNPGLFAGPPTVTRTSAATSIFAVDPPISGSSAMLRFVPSGVSGIANLCFRARDNGNMTTQSSVGVIPANTTVGTNVSAPQCVRVMVNGPPVAYFEADSLQAEPGQSLAFNACPRAIPSCSYDLDGSIRSWHWDFGDGVTADGVLATHTYAGPGIYIVRLTVTDDSGLTATMARTVRVERPGQSGILGEGAGSESPPVADAGGDLTVLEGTLVRVAGAGHGAGDRDTYQWTQVAGPTVILANASTPTLSFVAPSLADGREVVLMFALRISGGPADFVTVTVVSRNHAPAANAGGAVSKSAGETVTLDGSRSSDADNNALTYTWEQLTGPHVEIAGADRASASFVAPQGTAMLTFRLKVSDGTFTSQDIATVYVQPVEAAPEGIRIAYEVKPAAGGAQVEFVAIGAAEASWDFGDGSAPVSAVRVTHQYAAGSYAVKMTVGGSAYTQHLDIAQPTARGASAPASSPLGAFAWAVGLLALCAVATAVVVTVRMRKQR